MHSALRLAAAVFVSLACLEAATLAQTKGTPPSSTPPATPPVQPTQPTQRTTTQLQQQQQTSADLRRFALLSLEDRRQKLRKPGQGTVYAPEANVPRKPMREFQQGLKALDKKDYRSAEEHLLAATELYPKFASAFNALGLAYQMDPDKQDRKTGINAAAKNAFQQAVILNPTNDYALANLGNALLKENAWAEAEQVLRRAAAIRDGETITYANLMFAEAAQSHFSEVLITARGFPREAQSSIQSSIFFAL
jgi:Flp pilus assembly protein TadD